MPEKKVLIEKLKNIQQILHSGEEMGRKRLEQLGEELVTAFDSAIKTIDRQVNVLQEIRNNKEALKKWKIGFFRSIFPLSLRHILSMPFIYAMIVPVLLLHFFLELYQQVCFRLYTIPRVRARDYFVFDRSLLPYLNWFDKVNCVYCSYVNHFFQFAVEIGGRTERYWCPIKYANRMKKNHSQYELFTDFIDAETFRDKWQILRDFSDIRKADEEKKELPKEDSSIQLKI